MPIKLPARLPATETLREEGVMVIPSQRALRQDIRPLRIGLLNLMPNKEITEIQFARLLGATPLQIELSLVRMTHYQPRNTSKGHMGFYRPFSEARNDKLDGLIITGAPVEHLEFSEVDYWEELKEVFEWTQTNVCSTFAVCWGAMAMLNHFHGIKKHTLASKAFGCFRHDNLAPSSPYLRGFSDDCVVPVSRWTKILDKDIDNNPGLTTLLGSESRGPCLVEDPEHNALYMLNHLEYDSTSLRDEYNRDVAEKKDILVPKNYFPNNDPTRPPKNRWRSHGHLLYGNWINELYQSTPYDINAIGAGNRFRETSRTARPRISGDPHAPGA